MSKKILVIIIAAVVLVGVIVGVCVGIGSCNTDAHDNKTTTTTTTTTTVNQAEADLEAFYDKVHESQELLDEVADDIYSYWYDAIYEDYYGGNINTAILLAQSANSSNISRIKELDEEIGILFKSVKEGECGKLVKEVMSAYSDYYEFVINVSGSFKSYSADKETLKKELASLLRELSYEI